MYNKHAQSSLFINCKNSKQKFKKAIELVVKFLKCFNRNKIFQKKFLNFVDTNFKCLVLKYKKNYLNSLIALKPNYHHNNKNECKMVIKMNKDLDLKHEQIIDKLKVKKDHYSLYPSVASEDFYQKDEVAIKSDFAVISVGRFVPLKGFDLTIRSFIQFISALSAEEKAKCKLILVGTGEQKQFYKDLIQQNNAENYIEIIEWIDRRELMKMYEKASVFLFPSHEGAGMVVPEALSFGLPVVCLQNEGPGEFITEKCGFTVPQQEYDQTVPELSDALMKLFSDKDLQHKMSIEARKHYLDRFSWEKRGDHLNTIYNQI